MPNISATTTLGTRDKDDLARLLAAGAGRDGSASLEMEKSLNAHGDMPSVFLARAEGELPRFGYAEELFLVDSCSVAGKTTAAKFGARYEFTEYSMRYGDSLPDSLSFERASFAAANRQHTPPSSKAG